MENESKNQYNRLKNPEDKAKLHGCGINNLMVIHWCWKNYVLSQVYKFEILEELDHFVC